MLRTFSKAYGMAGLRLGYLLASDSWAPQFLDKIQYPYPISGIAEALAVRLMMRTSGAEKWWKSVKKERGWLRSKLVGL